MNRDCKDCDKWKRMLMHFHTWARRYVDGRMTIATQSFNLYTRDLIDDGVPLNDCDGTFFARDGMGRAYDNLTDEEATSREGLKLEADLEMLREVEGRFRENHPLSLYTTQEIRDELAKRTLLS